MSNYEYNAFTGNLDLVGSGASYINGVVATPASLPTTIGTPALDSVYLAKAGSGVWLVNRRPGGLYCRIANNGNSNDWQHLGAFPEVNAAANWEVYGSDATKRLKFAVDNLPTATLRTVDAPDGNGKMLVEGQSIGSTTRSSGAFTTLNATNGTITSSAPVLDLSQTWNNAAVTFTGLTQTITNTASAVGSRLFNFVVGSTSAFSARTMLGVGPTDALAIGGGDRGLVFGNNTFTNPNAGFFTLRWQTNLAGFNSSAILAWGADVYNLSYDLAVQRDAADTFAQRRGTNAQTYNIYNTYSNSTNYERGRIAWTNNVLTIGTEKGSGGGTARTLELQVDGTTFLGASTGGTVRFGSQSTQSTALVGWFGNCYMRPINAAAGVLTLLNNALDGFDRLQFGGTTSSFPALKRSSTTLQARLADDSADAPLSASLFSVGSGSFDGVIGRPNAGVIGFARADGATTYIAALGFDGTTRAFVANSGAFIGWSSGNATSVASGDTRLWRDAANVVAQRNGATGQTFRIYNADGTNFERLNFRWASNEFIIDAEAGGTGTLRGIKIGSATSSLLGFYGATPVDRPATVADPAGGGTIDAEARTAINDLIDRLQELGLIA